MCHLCKHTHNKKKLTIHSPSKTSDHGRRRGKKEKEGRDVLVSDIQAWKSVRCNLVVHRPFSSVRVSSCSLRWTISMRRRSSQCAPCWSDYDRQQTFKKRTLWKILSSLDVVVLHCLHPVHLPHSPLPPRPPLAHPLYLHVLSDLWCSEHWTPFFWPMSRHEVSY